MPRNPQRHTAAAELTACASAHALATTLATELASAVAAAQAARGEAVVALTGGTMGIAMLRALAASDARDQINWRRVTLVWGDERWLAAGDPERNATQAEEALLAECDVDPARVLRMPAAGESHDLDAAADAYSAQLATLAACDVVLLGVGPDGHVASLFPGRPEAEADGIGAIPVRNSPKPPPERLSMTLAQIRSAREVWLLVSGAEKHAAFARAFPQLADAEAAADPSGQGRTASRQADTRGRATESRGGRAAQAPDPHSADSLPAARVYGTERTRVFADRAALSGAAE